MPNKSQNIKYILDNFKKKDIIQFIINENLEELLKKLNAKLIQNIVYNMKNKTVGVHLSREKTLRKTVEKVIDINGNALQIFTSNPMNCQPANIDKYFKEIEEIKDLKCSYVIHASYTINIASLDTKQINLNFNIIKNDLLIANKLNAIGVILHVGKYVKNDPTECYNQMVIFMNKIIEFIKNNNLNTKIILETGAGQGTEMLVDIDEFINFYNKFDKNYISLCFDTCHVYSAGYNIIDSYNKIQLQTNNAISIIHLNGSKTKFGSRKDRHENLTLGFITLENIQNFIKNIELDIMIILETPDEKYYESEIKMINELIP